MSWLRNTKDKILKRLYSTANKDLLNADWEKFYWGINNKKIVIWGLTNKTQQFINAHRDKIEYIVDKHPQNWTTNYSGIPVVEPDIINEMPSNDTAFIILTDTDEAAEFIRRRSFKLYYAPSVLDKPKRLLKSFRNFKKCIVNVKSFFKSVGRFTKKAIKGFLNLPYTLVFDKIVPPEMQYSIKTLAYKYGNKRAKKANWKDFHKAASGKNIVLFGYCRATEKFIASNRSKYVIKACYALEDKWFGRELMGVPIKSPMVFEYSPETDIILVSYAVGFAAAAAMDYLAEKGVDAYYSLPAMEVKRLKYRLFRPPYLMKRAYGIFRAKNGIIRNFITYPIVCFLRICRIPPFYNRKRYKDLLAYKNKFKGKRCFIVCNGPSLTIEDVERLNHEFTFGVNGIYSLFDKTDWRPTFYCGCDPRWYKIHGTKPNANPDNWCVEKAFLAEYFKQDLNKLAVKKVQYIPFNYLDHFVKGEKHTYKYSKNLLYCSYNTQTVANMCINIAHYMGFSEIYIIGANCDYTADASYFDKTKNVDAQSIFTGYAIGRLMKEGYKFIKGKMDKYGVKVYNATRGGKLEVFPRVDFDTLFPYETMEYDYELMPDGSRNPITVSVNVITYGHEKHIRKALDSILAQKTKFRFEINVGEDKSPDNTREILLEYQEKYPDIFNMKLRDENLGPLRNAYDLFINAKGKYIAYLEGDDIWCDPYKLQKQVDFLEYHKEYAGCTSGAYTIDENDEYTNVDQYWDSPKMLYTYKDIDGYARSGNSNTMLHRNIFLNSEIDYSPYYRHNSLGGDAFTLVWVACNGDIFRMPEKTLAYRFLINPKGTNVSAQIRKNKYHFLDIFWVFDNIASFAKKNYGKKIKYTFLRTSIDRSLITLHKYPDKARTKEFFRMFLAYSNKFEFIAICIRRILLSLKKRIKQPQGIAKSHWLNNAANTNLLINSQFNKIDYAYQGYNNELNSDDLEAVSLNYGDQIILPKRWRCIKLPSESPAFYSSRNGLILDASNGIARIRQTIDQYNCTGKWVTFSVAVNSATQGELYLHIFNENGEMVTSAEFVELSKEQVLFVSKKIPKSCKKPAFQLMYKGDEPIEVRYLKVELGKKATGIVDDK